MGQDPLPNVVPDVNFDIEDAARLYVEARDRRMELTKDEVRAQEILLKAMKLANLEQYRTTDGLFCTLDVSFTEKVKVAKGKEEKD